jgi:hypothetical protein
MPHICDDPARANREMHRQMLLSSCHKYALSSISIALSKDIGTFSVLPPLRTASENFPKRSREKLGLAMFGSLSNSYGSSGLKIDCILN